ncbi:hypothetical protein [Bacillus safensis]|uniref:hypothetical protein n=1 Tax=Bacillus safensis TaxID=561879 RepID=UPI00358F43CC
MRKYIKVIQNFSKNLDVVQSFLASLEKMMEFNKVGGELEKIDKLKEVKDVSKKIAAILEKLKHSENNLSPEIIEELNGDFDLGDISVTGGNSLKISFRDSDVGEGFAEFIKISDLSNKQVAMIYTSSLINLVVYFELLANKLIQMRLENYPETMNIKQKMLSFKEIEDIGSIEEAKKYLIQQEVISLMNSGFLTWMEYFKRNFKVEVKGSSAPLDKINEIFSRRHLYVHNEGIVSSIYLSRVKAEYKGEAKLGKKLKISEAYLLDSLEAIKSFGLLLALETWRREEKESEDRHEFILDFGFGTMKNKEWKISSELYYFLLNEQKITSGTLYMAKMNYWLCMKNLGRLEDFRSEIEAEDFSALDPAFIICREALLDNYDKLFSMLDNQLGYSIKLKELENWPIFEDLRNHEKYQEFIAGKSQGELNIISDLTVK